MYNNIQYTKYKLSSDALFVTYTIIQSIMRSEMCTHLEQWAADCAAFCRSRDSNPQPWVTSGFKSNALSIRPTTAHVKVFRLCKFVGLLCRRVDDHYMIYYFIYKIIYNIWVSVSV